MHGKPFAVRQSLLLTVLMILGAAQLDWAVAMELQSPAKGPMINAFSPQMEDLSAASSAKEDALFAINGEQFDPELTAEIFSANGARYYPLVRVSVDSLANQSNQRSFVPAL